MKPIKISWIRNVFRGYYSARCRRCDQVFCSAVVLADAIDSAHNHLALHKYQTEQVAEPA